MFFPSESDSYVWSPTHINFSIIHRSYHSPMVIVEYIRVLFLIWMREDDSTAELLARWRSRGGVPRRTQSDVVSLTANSCARSYRKAAVGGQTTERNRLLCSFFHLLKRLAVNAMQTFLLLVRAPHSWQINNGRPPCTYVSLIIHYKIPILPCRPPFSLQLIWLLLCVSSTACIAICQREEELWQWHVYITLSCPNIIYIYNMIYTNRRNFRGVNEWKVER